MHELKDILEHFQLSGELISIDSLKAGHIHLTWVSTWKTDSGEKAFCTSVSKPSSFP